MTVQAYVQKWPRGEGDHMPLRLRFAGPPANDAEAEIHVVTISTRSLILRSSETWSVGDLVDIELLDGSISHAHVVWHDGELVACHTDKPIAAAVSSADLLLDPSMPYAASGSARADTKMARAETPSIDSFASRLVKLRRARRIPQETLARTLSVSVPAVSAWEAGRSRPRAPRLEALAEFYGITLAELLDPKQTDEFTVQIAQARKTIATAAGVSEDRVRITIDI